MFGIEFSELLVIGVVALIVLGPERLPKVARTAGHLFGRLQRYASEVKQQVKREMDALINSSRNTKRLKMLPAVWKTPSAMKRRKLKRS